MSADVKPPTLTPVVPVPETPIVASVAPVDSGVSVNVLPFIMSKVYE